MIDRVEDMNSISSKTESLDESSALLKQNSKEEEVTKKANKKRKITIGLIGAIAFVGITVIISGLVCGFSFDKC